MVNCTAMWTRCWMPMRLLALLGLLFATPALNVVSAQEMADDDDADALGLIIGDPAPPLAVKSFIKGEQFKQFEKGTTYVVEFWATWCGPCLASIPHLSELQKEHPEVVIVGVCVMDEAANIKQFMKKKGDQFGYRVAVDDEVEGAEAGAMVESWLKPAAQSGIPAAFIVNGEGQIAFIGHPQELDEPLKKVLDGSWDVDAARKEFVVAHERELAMQKLAAEIIAAQDGPAIVKLLDKAMDRDPGLERQLAGLKLSALSTIDVDDTVTYGSKLLKDVFKNDADQLNNLAWNLLGAGADDDGDEPNPKLKKLAPLALKMAQRANDLSGGKSAAVADTLGLAHYIGGDYKQAVENQQRAVKLLGKDDPTDEGGIRRRLERYEAAAEKSSSKPAEEKPSKDAAKPSKKSKN